MVEYRIIYTNPKIRQFHCNEDRPDCYLFVGRNFIDYFGTGSKQIPEDVK